MVAAVQSVLRDHPSVAIFTFGYGGDHDDGTLRALAAVLKGHTADVARAAGPAPRRRTSETNLWSYY